MQCSEPVSTPTCCRFAVLGLNPRKPTKTEQSAWNINLDPLSKQCSLAASRCPGFLSLDVSPQIPCPAQIVVSGCQALSLYGTDLFLARAPGRRQSDANRRVTLTLPANLNLHALQPFWHSIRKPGESRYSDASKSPPVSRCFDVFCVFRFRSPVALEL